MKTIPKRPDLYNNPTDKNSSIEKQMSQLLQVKNLLSLKLQVLTKTITEDVFSFITKNHPRQIKDINLINAEKNLFGTDRTFGQFSIDFKEFLLKLQSEVKGFINNGIMDGFIKLNDLMLRRQEFCNRLMNRIQQNAMNGSTIFSKSFGSNSLCMKCGSNMEKDKIVQTREAILLGGQKISDFYHKQLYIAEEEDDQNGETDFYNKIKRVRKNIETNEGINPSEIKSQEDIKHNLERLQNNLEMRKYDILACLVEMGQFGSTLIQSQDMIQNALKQHSLEQEISRISSLLPTIHKLPPKFDFKQFTFDVSKYFYKEIKDIETSLLGIKTKYRSLISTQYEHQSSKQIQCDIAKDQYEKQLDKYKKKTQRQIKSLNERISEIELLNKNYKSKIDEYENALKSHILTKLDEDTKSIESNITIEKRISRLVDQYEHKIKQQEKQLKSLRESKVVSQNLIGILKPLQEKIQAQLSNENMNENQPIKQEANSNLEKDLQNIDSNVVRKKISLYLQPIIKKLYQNQSSSTEKKSEKSLKSIENQSQKLLSFTQIAKLMSNNLIEENISKTKRQSTEMLQKKVEKDLKICSSILQIHLRLSKYSPPQFNLHRTNSRPIERKQSQVLHPRQIQILTDKSSNKMLSHFNERQNQSKVKEIKNHKLTKVKSQENTKTEKINRSAEVMQVFKQGQNAQLINTNESLKRYVSEHDAINIIEKKSSIPSMNKIPKEKASKKALKALSLTILKKGQQQQPKSSVKLPSISQYQKSIHRLDNKIKQLQKIPQMSSKSNLLMKKKRKKRNFSQQALSMQSLFSNNEMIMSLGTNLQKNQLKQKIKKQYIIDFIPKIDESNVSKCKQDQIAKIQGHIQELFDVDSVKKDETQSKKIKKGKYFTKTLLTKENDDSSYMMQKLKKQQIQLSTKIYSLLAAIKSSDYTIYKMIREKITQEFEKKQKIKTNCDYISMTMDFKDNSVNHLPLSLSLNHPDSESLEQNSFQIKKQVYQTMSTNSNQIQRQGMKKDIDQIKANNLEVKSDNAQLNKIINFLIVKHRKTCRKAQKEQDPNKKSNLKLCDHLKNFYQTLVLFTGKSPSQPSTIQKN